MADYKNDPIWEKTHQITLAIYLISKQFPPEEMVGLTDEIRRTCRKIPKQLAKAHKAEDPVVKMRFYDELTEIIEDLTYEMRLSRDLGYMGTGPHDRVLKDIGQVTRRIESLKKRVEQALLSPETSSEDSTSTPEK